MKIFKKAQDMIGYFKVIISPGQDRLGGEKAWGRMITGVYCNRPGKQIYTDITGFS